MKKLITLICFFAITSILFGQNRETDSLEALLHNSVSDSVKIKVLNELVLICREIDLEKALHYAQESKALSKAIHDETGLRACLHTIGVINTTLGRYQPAIQSFKEAIALGQKLKLKKEVAASYHNIGNVYLNLADYPAALSQYLKSLKIKEEIGNKKGMASTLNSIGNLYLAQFNNKMAIENYFRSLAFYRELNDSNGLAIVYDGIAAANIELKNYGDALKFTEMSLQIKRNLNNLNGQTFCYNNLGKIYSFLDNFNLSLKNYLISLEISLKKGNPYDLATIYIAIADVYTDKKEYNRAKEYLTKGLQLAKEGGSNELIRTAYKLFSNLYVMQGDYKNAYEYSELFFKTNDSIFNETKNRAITEIQTKYETEKKEKEIKILQQQTLNLKQSNEIKALQLSRNRYAVYAISGITLFIFIIGFLVFSQVKLRATKSRLEAEQKLLRSRMNPHFIFNSLNSIQDFIANYEREDALKYLSKFSKLTRSILNQSAENDTTLADELDMLKLYVELELLRFNNKFDCTFDIGSEINLFETRIPSMLLQPFLENAISHAFIGKTDDCHIVLTMHIKADKLICCIEDNGIGRVKGMEIKNRKSFQYPGLGIEVTTERMKNIRNITGKEAGLQITDLLDSDGNPNGTKVELQFSMA